MQHQRNIEEKLQQVCQQWKRRVLLKGGSQFLIAACVSLLLAIGLDSLFTLDSGVRWFFLISIVAGCLIFLFWKTVRPFLNIPTRPRIARFLEEKYPHLEDRLITAVELGTRDSDASRAIVEKLLEDTRFHVDPIDVSTSFKSTDTTIWSYSALTLALLMAALLFLNTELLQFQYGRLFTPWRFPTIKPKPTLVVLPGNARVQRGDSQQISCEVTGFEAETMLLYYSTSDSAWNKAAMDPTHEMNMFVYNLFDAQVKTKYYVKADENISEIFELTVYDAPHIKRVDLTYSFPTHTGLPSKREVDGGDIWAPEGTVVTISAIADKPLKSAQIVVGEGQALATSVLRDSVITAKLTISKDNFYSIHITDLDALTNEPAPEYFIHALPDQPPLLTIERPARDTKASMLEEVPIQISVKDDYGTPDVTLKYVLSGSEEKEQPLKLTRESGNVQNTAGVKQIFAADHLFYIEDLNLRPGDFIGYYIEAKSSNSENPPVSSEIYFIEIRPFETDFSRPLSQEQMAGGGNMPGRLSQIQKEILIATWKTFQKKSVLEQQKYSEDTGVLVESQQNLQEVTEGTLFQLEQRAVFTRDVNSEVTKFYTDAIDAMKLAVTDLASGDLSQAQMPQRKALQSLLQAEAQIREVQIQQSQGQGAGNNASLNELSQLFEEEMDKLNNKYETLNQTQQNTADEQVNEALQKVKELAKRQQDFNRRMRDLARADLAAEQKKRKIEELKREQERIRRETQELTRQMQELEQQNAGLPQDVQENLRRATSEMNNASHNLRNDNTELAAAKGTRALNRLNQLEDSLRKNQKESLRRQINELDQKFQELAQNQRSLLDDLNELSQEQAQSENLAAAGRKQKNLLEDIQRTQQQVESLHKQSRREHSQLSREIQKATKQIADEQIEKKMKEAHDLLEGEKLNSAVEANKHILNSLEKAAEQLTTVTRLLAETKEEKLDLALKQTRRLREQLEDLQNQTSELEVANTGENPTPNLNSRSAPNDQAGPSESTGRVSELDSQSRKRIDEELVRSLNDFDSLQESLLSDTSLTQIGRNLNDNLEGIVKSFGGGTLERMQLIEQKVLLPLKSLEAELAQQLELLRNKEKLFLAREETIPSGYEELVQKYYEALSRGEQGSSK